MPRGNPNFGRDVKSPGRPPKARPDGSVATSQKVADAFIASHLPEYLQVLHDAATGKSTSDPKVRVDAANKLIIRHLGTPGERSDSDDMKLVAALKELVKLVAPQRATGITVDSPGVKELPPPDDLRRHPDDPRSVPDDGASSGAADASPL